MFHACATRFDSIQDELNKAIYVPAPFAERFSDRSSSHDCHTCRLIDRSDHAAGHAWTARRRPAGTSGRSEPPRAPAGSCHVVVRRPPHPIGQSKEEIHRHRCTRWQAGRWHGSGSGSYYCTGTASSDGSIHGLDMTAASRGRAPTACLAASRPPSPCRRVTHLAATPTAYYSYLPVAHLRACHASHRCTCACLPRAASSPLHTPLPASY